MQQEIQAAQERLLEKRRELSHQTAPKPIGLLVPSSLHPLPEDDLCPLCDTALTHPPDWLGGQAYCRVCADAQSAIQLDLVKQDELERAAWVKQAQIERYLADSCIGERFKGKVFADYQPVSQAATHALSVCREYASGFRSRSGTSLIFIGSTGTGKNMLSAIIGQDIITRGFSFLHTTALKIVRKYKDSWKQPDVTEEQVLSYYTTPDLLVIDEVGVQFGSPTEQLYLTELINDRYEAMKPMILIANLTLKQVEDALGARSMERFHENGGRVVVFNWASYRRQQRENI